MHTDIQTKGGGTLNFEFFSSFTIKTFFSFTLQVPEQDTKEFPLRWKLQNTSYWCNFGVEKNVSSCNVSKSTKQFWYFHLEGEGRGLGLKLGKVEGHEVSGMEVMFPECE